MRVWAAAGEIVTSKTSHNIPKSKNLYVCFPPNNAPHRTIMAPPLPKSLAAIPTGWTRLLYVTTPYSIGFNHIPSGLFYRAVKTAATRAQSPPTRTAAVRLYLCLPTSIDLMGGEVSLGCQSPKGDFVLLLLRF